MSSNVDGIPFEAYKGDLPYIFVSYCHADSAIVYPEMKRLHDAGYRIWYDEGIAPTKEWSEEIAFALQNSAIFVFFVSPRAIKSKSCRDEAYFALDMDKTFLAIYLEDTELPGGLKLRTSRIQAIFKHELTLETYDRRLSKFLDLLNLRSLDGDGGTFAVLESSVIKAKGLPIKTWLVSLYSANSGVPPPVAIALATIVLALVFWAKFIRVPPEISKNNSNVPVNSNANVVDTGSGGDVGASTNGPDATPSLPGIHLEAKGSRSSRDNLDRPLAEADRPNRNGSIASEKAASLTHIVDWLDVEHSKRYEPQPDRTASNIYAYDYCNLAGVYLPRVWWLSNAIEQLKRSTAEPISGSNVTELSTSSLCMWLDRYGSNFGWKQTTDMDTLQTRANEGQVALICGYTHVGAPANVALVVPETAHLMAKRENGRVTSPLQSRAGKRNFKYSVMNWWAESTIKISFWTHD